jgi:large repetitive protein
MKNKFTIALLLLSTGLFSQLINPFNVRYQVTQKGNITFVSNTSMTCNNNCSATGQMPPSGTGKNNDFTQAYVDIDGDATTFMSSSDSLNLPACSQITWAGLYWGGWINNASTHYAVRKDVKIKVNNGTYTALTADSLVDNSLGFNSYHCFTDITSLVQGAGIKARFTLANVAGNPNASNKFGGWSIVVVYKNDNLDMRQLTVFEGLANIQSGSNGTVNIPVSGFLTPPTGPVNFELGIIAYDGDRSFTGDSLLFNGAGSFRSVNNGVNPANDFFNSTITRGGTLTPFRNPSFNNTLGYDADMVQPNNSSFLFLPNNGTSCTFRMKTSSETYLPQVITTAIDVYEADVRVGNQVTDINGGTVQPGDILEYKITVKNIGSDVALNSRLLDTIAFNVDYVPGSLNILTGQNAGVKTDAAGDDQAEYDATGRRVLLRIGTGANASTGGSVLNSPLGNDSTVFTFRVTATNDCVKLLCDNNVPNRAYIFWTSQISGNSLNGASNPNIFDGFGCPIPGSTNTAIQAGSCASAPDTTININCQGVLANLYTRPNYNFFDASFVAADTITISGIYYAIYQATPTCVDTVILTVNIAACINTDGDGVAGSGDLDEDNDGILDAAEGTGDTDGDGQPDYLDLDSDNDGIPDLHESGLTPAQIALLDPNGDGVVNGPVGSNGIPDVAETFAGSGISIVTQQDSDGDGVPNSLDLDSDNDGVNDLTEAGLAGFDMTHDGMIDGPDTDGDGIVNATGVDNNNTYGGNAGLSNADFDGDGQPNSQDLDSDNDGIVDLVEAQFLLVLDANNDGMIDGADSDGDGIIESAATDTIAGGFGGTGIVPVNRDNSGGANYLDIDSDNDGIVDNTEAQSTLGYIAPSGTDTDGDGIDNAYDNSSSFGGSGLTNLVNTDGGSAPDYVDTDSDNDGDIDALEGWDTNNDGNADTTPSGNDADGDGLDDNYDVNDAAVNPTNGTTPTSYPNLDNAGSPERDWREGQDNDGDGIANSADLDDDNDGILDAVEGNVDSDGDGKLDAFDLDSDNDGVLDLYEAGYTSTQLTTLDPDGDGIVNGPVGTNGIPDAAETSAGSGVVLATPSDNDGDGRVDSRDLDSDNDGISDLVEAGYATADADNDGIVDGTDSDGDGIINNAAGSDNNTILGGSSAGNRDSDADGSPDSRDLDSDNDGISDVVESGHAALDTDNDGIVNGTDTDADGIINVVGIDNNTTYGGNNLGTIDSDGDGVPNHRDLDSDNDGIFDVLEDGNGALDANSNGVVDGTDTDGDGIINVAAIDNNATYGGNNLNNSDFDGDGVANSVDLDSDNDGQSDLLEAYFGTIVDANLDGMIDGNDTDGDGIIESTITDTTPGTFGGNTYVPLNRDGTGGTNNLDIDTDGDGIVDNIEGQFTSSYIPPSGIDADGDGLDDAYDNFPGQFGGTGLYVQPNTDGGSAPDYVDTNSDNDAQSDAIEAWDFDNNGVADVLPAGTDADGDGLDDNYDNNDALVNPTNGTTPTSYPNLDESSTPETDWREAVDYDLDGIANDIDIDDDNDGIPDTVEGLVDTDGDGTPDYLDLDSDNDGIPDLYENGLTPTQLAALDANNDGMLDGPVGTNGLDNGVETAVDNGVLLVTTADNDADGIPNYLDLDSDNDGISDVVESGNASLDANNDGLVDFPDTDGDGVGNNVAIDAGVGSSVGFTSPGNNDYDNDGIPDYIDLDSDNDGVFDVDEAGLSALDNDNNGVVDGDDNDGDGVVNAPGLDENVIFGADNAGSPDTDGDGNPNANDLDSDNDGIIDAVEGGGTDPDNDGIIGNGPFVDTDDDGLSDLIDTDNGGTPLDSPDTDGDGHNNIVDLDSDNDGISDLIEAGGNDPDNNGIVGTGALPLDTDNDGLADAADPSNAGTPLPSPDTDGDGQANYADVDSDNDGITDVAENGGADADGNGIIDGFADADNDGLADVFDTTVGFGGAGIVVANSDYDTTPNYLDLDSDGDGIVDLIETGGTDADGNGQVDGTADADNDGLNDAVDPDQAGTPNYTTGVDANNDGMADSFPNDNADAAGAPNFMDIDADNDGIVDNIEAQPTTGYIFPSGNDTDGDGIDDAYDATSGFGGAGITVVNSDGADVPDYIDADSDNDGASDLEEGNDFNNDGNPDVLPSGNDSDNDGLDDSYDNVNIVGVINITNNDAPPTSITFPNVDTPGGELDWRDPIDSDGDGVADNTDLDDDNDGILDTTEGTADSDGDGVPDSLDLDSDNDGILDIVEAGGVDTNGDGMVDNFTDANNDGLADSLDPNTGGTALPVPDTDGDGLPDYLDLDSDNDGITDVIEAGGSDPDNDGVIGTGVPADNDNDGIPDAVDPDQAGTALPVPDSDGDGNADYIDLDSDNDGITDVIEAGGSDPDLNGIIGTGTVPTDTDGDGIADVVDLDNGGNPLVIIDTDADGVPNYLDRDSDNDGITDVAENGGTDADGDGILDGFADADNDGLADVFDTVNGFGGAGIVVSDMDGDSIPNYLDLDSDNDGITDVRETGGTDADNNGQIDGAADLDNDGLLDTVDPSQGGTPSFVTGNDVNNNGYADVYPDNNTDAAGNPDYLDIDSDNDGIVDIIEAQFSSGYLAPSGNDADGDGIDDVYDGFIGFGGTGLTPVNTDGTDTPDYMDLDSDNDSYSDLIEGNDFNGDHIPDLLPSGNDTDNDGLDNAYDAVSTTGTSNVTNNDGPPTGTTFPDISQPGSDLDWRTPEDTDNDGITNNIDIDDDNDGIIDTEEASTALNNGDTDGDHVPDSLDLDSDNDGIADVIEAGGTDPDNDGIIGTGGITDVNGDGLDDSLPNTGLDPGDFDGDGRPNYQDLDSDNDGINDLSESGGGQLDANSDGVVDGPDTDYDGLMDSADLTSTGSTTANPTNTDGTNGPDYLDLDSDNDGINDIVESGNTASDNNSDGVVDGLDTDGDGIFDAADANDTAYGDPDNNDGPDDFDGDSNPDFQDLDSDNDGINDVTETGNDALDANSNGVIDGTDADGDGILDAVDANDNLYGDSDMTDNVPDFDSDGLPDYTDLDSDNDGIDDVIEGGNGSTDANGDGVVDGNDADGDGILDLVDADPNTYGDADLNDTPADTDADGHPDYTDLDSDNDGINDVEEGGNGNADTNDDGVIDGTDIDGDGILDPADGNDTGYGDGPGGSTEVDTDSDGTPDYQDLDSDGDGINDVDENGGPDLDANDDGVVDGNIDSDGDGILDPADGDDQNYGDGTGNSDPVDTDGDGRPNFTDADADGDTLADGEEGLEDCDADGIPNFLDADPCGVVIPEGFSPNGDGINDDLEIKGITAYKDNNVTIFNRWGNVVYEGAGYNNSTVKWDGTNTGKLSSGSGPVPEGTYFYIIDLGDGSPIVSGYIYLNR